jgi:four helix bundle protein
MDHKNKFDLEDRLIDYTIRVSKVVDEIENSRLGNHIAGQMTRSSSSPALNYGEAQSAESRKDFVHKLKIILKELKETRVCLKITKRKPLVPKIEKLVPIMDETEELIRIIFSSIKTTKKNMGEG